MVDRLTAEEEMAGTTVAAVARGVKVDVRRQRAAWVRSAQGRNKRAQPITPEAMQAMGIAVKVAEGG